MKIAHSVLFMVKVIIVCVYIKLKHLKILFKRCFEFLEMSALSSITERQNVRKSGHIVQFLILGPIRGRLKMISYIVVKLGRGEGGGGGNLTFNQTADWKGTESCASTLARPRSYTLKLLPFTHTENKTWHFIRIAQRRLFQWNVKSYL